jgi:hypothetical protein
MAHRLRRRAAVGSGRTRRPLLTRAHGDAAKRLAFGFARWKGGRAVECTGLENRQAGNPPSREFESPPFRLLPNLNPLFRTTGASCGASSQFLAQPCGSALVLKTVRRANPVSGVRVPPFRQSDEVRTQRNRGRLVGAILCSFGPSVDGLDLAQHLGHEVVGQQSGLRSAFMVRHGFPLLFAPRSPFWCIRRSTRLRPTCSPERSSAFHIGGEP